MKNLKNIVSVILVFCSFWAVAANIPQEQKVPKEIKCWPVNWKCQSNFPLILTKT